ncbi:MAG: glycosyltransferase family 39 protein [Gemmatimonadaceae bacterium]
MRLGRFGLAAVIIGCVAALLRIGLVDRGGLWGDEIFSLAMATGHSLEHPAAAANPAFGDFVEAAPALPAAAYRRYAEHESPAAGPSRVIRAVLMSDSSPPLYYLLLNGWTRLVGTSDWALRLFSVICSIACIPILASLARQLGGHRAVVPACVLFSFAPQSVFYSIEGRMYSLVWLLVLMTAWLTIELHRRGATPPLMLLWIGASAAGLLTHYFFAFVWAALCLWLIVYPHRLDRRMSVLLILATGLIVLPWYLLLPQSMSTWRVTGNWLTIFPGRGLNPRTAPLKVVWSYFSAVGERSSRLDVLLLIVFGMAAAAVLFKAGRRLVSMRWQLLWFWVIAADLGLVVFDLWRGTYTRAVFRYALAGLPAAFLLVAVGLARLPSAARNAVLIAIVLLWIPGLWRIDDGFRAGNPFRRVARSVGKLSDSADVVIVHSIPAGTVGIARYLESGAFVAPWVGQLGQRRAPEDIAAVSAGRRHVFLVKIHDMGQPAPEEAYLRAHGTVINDSRYLDSRTLEFAMPGATMGTLNNSIPHQ